MFVVEPPPAPKPELVPLPDSAPPPDPVLEAAAAEPDADSFRSSYCELRERIVQKMDAGHLEQAQRLCEEALRLAERLDDEELIDQAYCNRCEVARALGYSEDSFGRLREILMRNRSVSIGFSAAYNLAHGYRKKKEYKKALFYARISRDRALATRNTNLILKSHNEIGNCLLAESYYKEAVEEYERALELLPKEHSAFHTSVFVNLAYSKIVLGDLREGFHLLFAALRWCRRHPAESIYEAWVHLCLSVGFTELGRWRYAWQHGRRGLQLAETTGSDDGIKMGLYLLGEVEKAAGDVEAAYGYFSRMQREFYPETANLPEMMLVFETKQLVNLRA